MEIISSYSRADAIRDGVLIDITDIAKRFGFKYPVAITSNLYYTYIDPNGNMNSIREVDNTLIGDVLTTLYYSIKNSKENETNIVTVKMTIEISPNETSEIEFWAHCGPGDDYRPVITIMLPEDY